jgi:hypothetical protein
MELGSDDVVRVLEVPDWKRKRDAYNHNSDAIEPQEARTSGRQVPD